VVIGSESVFLIELYANSCAASDFPQDFGDSILDPRAGNFLMATLGSSESFCNEAVKYYGFFMGLTISFFLKVLKK
jgi:hypothetical protein